LKPLFIAALVFGFFAVALLHETNLIKRFSKRVLPAQIDPLRRVRGWRTTARAVEQARQKLAVEGKPTFIIGDHYGITGEISFYLPEARRHVQKDPMVFFRTTSRPKNQFYFWPGYENRKGQNAIYVQQIDLPKLESGWFSKWLTNETNSLVALPKGKSAPPDIVKQFSSVTDLGVVQIPFGKRVFRQVQLFECRDLRDFPK
jgi:hypothetical protein